jgi:death-on-curing protein
MNPELEPEFLTREIVDAIHEEQIKSYGGLHGVRDENALESAVMAAQNVYYYGGGDVYEIAAAYAYHLAESQAYLDGNKRTGIQAAFVFLEGCGLSCQRLPEDRTYDAMIKVATHEMSRAGLAEYFRSTLTS